ATLSILDSCVKHGIKKFVFTSSAAVYGNSPKLPKREDMLPMPISPYAASKLGVEHACIVYNYLYRLNFVCLRVFNVYGPRQDPSNQYSGVISKFMQAALSNKPLIIYGDGTQTRDFVYVVDVVDALQRAATARVNGVFNIATGNATPIQRLAKLVIKLTGSKSSIKHLPRREGDVRASRASIAKAKRLLGWKPKIGLEQGLGYTIEWFKTKA
ncbi:NAD-dependent epimerase/dehydratase family protein, partial [Candidatus Woesearchaeota archaeon]|nr:NAD-dependent epimerase/dehydratase family protein [Candidatus Woesearchaeota archaeon]